jgi:hypothetical protein
LGLCHFPAESPLILIVFSAVRVTLRQRNPTRRWSRPGEAFRWFSRSASGRLTSTFGRRMNLALYIFPVFAILLVVRHCWITSQAKRAICGALAGRSFVILKIRTANVFRDYGSARSAFLSSLSIRDYGVRCRFPDGSENELSVQADFHPISGSLRSINLRNAEQSGGGNSAALRASP